MKVLHRNDSETSPIASLTSVSFSSWQLLHTDICFHINIVHLRSNYKFYLDNPSTFFNHYLSNSRLHFQSGSRKHQFNNKKLHKVNKYIFDQAHSPSLHFIFGFITRVVGLNKTLGEFAFLGRNVQTSIVGTLNRVNAPEKRLPSMSMACCTHDFSGCAAIFVNKTIG